MPRLKYCTPEPLIDLCLTAVVRCLETDLVLCELTKSLAPSSLLLRRVDLSLAKIANELSDYMSVLPGTLSEMVRQKITTRVIKKYTSSTSSQSKNTSIFNCLPIHTMTLRLLEVILNEDVHTFDLSDLDPLLCSESPQSLRPANGDPELWELLLDRCTELRKFAVPPSLNNHFGADIGSFITFLAPQCHQLTEVIIKDAVRDGKVLSALGEHCPNLRVLDVTGSPIVCTDILYLLFPKLTEAECVSNYSPKSKKGDLLPNLPRGFSQSRLCNKLRELIVSNTRMRSLGVYYALMYLPNLESLGVCKFVGSGIRKLWMEGLCSFNLKQVHAAGLTKEKVNLICATCSKLQSLYVSCGGSHPFPLKFPTLSKVGQLQFLTLESLYELHLTGLSYAPHLTELTLHAPGVDVGDIAEACPLLTKLTLTKEPKRTVTISNNRFKPSLFKNLLEIQVDCPVFVNIATFIITEAPLLRVVKFVRVKKISDKILRSWLDKNPLLFLETWLLTYAHLTIDSVSLLLCRCPNLSTLGRLSGWDVRSWESRRLQKDWQGYNVNLVIFSHKQEDIVRIIDATASSDEEE